LGISVFIRLNVATPFGLVAAIWQAAKATSFSVARPAIPPRINDLLSPGLMNTRSIAPVKIRSHERTLAVAISAKHRGSIHSVAAQVQGAPACNGWAFWHVERRGELVLIDRLRQQLRAELP